MALKIEEIVETLRSNQIPTDKIRAIVEELQGVEEEKKTEKEPGAKKQFVLLKNTDDTGFAVQVKEDQDVGQTTELIKTAARAFNQTRKGQKNPVRNVTQALRELPAKFLVEANVWRKTKEDTRVIDISEENI
jgi:hypothetical protein